MDMKLWLDRVGGGASVNAVAKAAHLTQSTLDGQLRSASGLKPETVVKIARAFRADPVSALVELGLITAEEARADHDLSEAEHLAWLRDAEDELLLREIGRRLNERERVESLDD